MTDGNFLDCQNSQEEDTPTVILVIGDTRCLEFELYHQTSIQEKVKPKVRGHFNFKHGSLFILHPRDEKPTIRYSLEKYGHTFFKHSCKGVKNIENGLSIGIAFRATKHLVEVNSENGCVVLNNNLGSCQFNGSDQKQWLLNGDASIIVVFVCALGDSDPNIHLSFGFFLIDS